MFLYIFIKTDKTFLEYINTLLLHDADKRKVF
jgi:hypothetical protein